MKQMYLVSQAYQVMKSVAESIKIGSDNRIVCITTSIERKDPKTLDWYEKDRQSLVDSGFDVSDYTLTGKNADQLQKDLSEYRHIYVSGGDVAWLIEQSYRSGFVTLISDLVTTKGVIYIGSSAGGIVCGPSIPPFYDLNNDYFTDNRVQGFGLVDFTTMPHWGRGDKGERYLEERLPQINDESHQPFILLNDYQYVHVQGNRYEVVDIRRISQT